MDGHQLLGFFSVRQILGFGEGAGWVEKYEALLYLLPAKNFLFLTQACFYPSH